MADKKISQLTTLAQADVAVTADFLPIVDTSATETKKATPQAVVLGTLGATSANVGIGTASPAAKLDVSGQARATSLAVNAPSAIWNSNEVIRGLSSVNAPAIVGQITGGASTPSYVSWNNAASGTRHHMLFADGAGGSTRGLITTDGAAGLQFAYGTTEGFRLDSSGNLGIGTASPSARLHVVGNQYRQNDSTGSFGFVINTTGGTTLLETLFGGSAFGIRTGGGSTDFINIDSNGNTTTGAGTLATNATNGFLYIPTCAGTPTGTPTAKTGYAPVVVNTTNNKLYFYSGGAWRDAGP